MPCGTHKRGVEVEGNVNIAGISCNGKVVETWLICASKVVIDARSRPWRDGEVIVTIAHEFGTSGLRSRKDGDGIDEKLQIR